MTSSQLIASDPAMSENARRTAGHDGHRGDVLGHDRDIVCWINMSKIDLAKFCKAPMVAPRRTGLMELKDWGQ